MVFTDDPIADYETYESRCNRSRGKLPVCDLCGEAIEEGEPYYSIGNECWCESCIENCKRYGSFE